MKWVGFLSVIVIVSALFVVVVRHQNRLEFLDVRAAEKQRDQLNDSGDGFSLRKQPGPATTSLNKQLEMN